MQERLSALGSDPLPSPLQLSHAVALTIRFNCDSDYRRLYPFGLPLSIPDPLN